MVVALNGRKTTRKKKPTKKKTGISISTLATQTLKKQTEKNPNVLPQSLKASEKFMASLLKCSPVELCQSNHSETLRLALLEKIYERLHHLPMPTTTPKSQYPTTTPISSRHFYQSRASLVMEEARYVLSEALWKNKGTKSPTNHKTISMKLVSIKDASKTGKTNHMIMTFEKATSFTPKELFDMRPGGIFQIKKSKPRNNNNNSNNNNNNNRPNNQNSSSATILGSVFMDKYFDRNGNGSGTISFMVYQPCSANTSKNYEWMITPITTLVSHMRQFEACHDEPPVAFLSRLLTGHKQTNNNNHTDHHPSDTVTTMIQQNVDDADDSDDDSDDSGDSDDEIIVMTAEEAAKDAAATLQNKHSSSTTTTTISHKDMDSTTTTTTTTTITTPFRTCSLNPTQQKASREFIQSPPSTLTLVQGPPGTGKTTFVVSTLYEILTSSYSQNRRVLVCAPTNKAITVLASRFLEVIRSNHTTSPNKIGNVALLGVEDKLLSDETKHIKDPQQEIHNTTSNNGGGGGKRRRRHNSIDSHTSNSQEDQDDDAFRVSTLPMRRVFVYTWIQTVMDDLRSFQNNVLESATVTKTMFQDAKLLQQKLFQSIPNLLKRTQNGKLKELCTKWVNLVKHASNTTKTTSTTAKYAIHQVLEDFISTLQMNVDPNDVTKEVLATANVIFCTLSTAGVSVMKQTKPVDDLIVDEAAAAPESELFIPFHLKPNRMLVVGDPKQLPATVNSRHAIQAGFDKSMMERLMFDCGMDHTMLDVQYRMKPSISQFPSKQFYEDAIQNGPNVKEPSYGDDGDAERNTLLLSDSPPYSFFHVEGKEQQMHGCSYFNRDEAMAVVQLVKSLREKAITRKQEASVLATPWNSPERIRIITFYQAQVITLQRLLKQHGLGGVLVATVDSSQGCEADVVIVSFVRSNNNHSRNQASSRASAGFLTDDRRLNVSLTRAKYQLICIGNVHGTLSQSGSLSLKAMVDDAKERKCVSDFPFDATSLAALSYSSLITSNTKAGASSSASQKKQKQYKENKKPSGNKNKGKKRKVPKTSRKASFDSTNSSSSHKKHTKKIKAN